MHHGRSAPDPSTTGMRRLDGAPARGLRWSWLIFVGNAGEASDGGSPLIEFLRSRRKVKEQLRVLCLELALVFPEEEGIK